MAIPRASVGGLFGSGVFPTAPHQIDIAGAINAISGGASSLMHGAYLRKMGQQNYQLQLARLKQEGELHQAQLQAIEEYRKAGLGMQQQRIAAPSARQQATQKRAYGDLTKEFPEHTLVQPDESGQPPEFDAEGTDYVSALKDARGIAAKHKAETDKQTDKLDTLQKAAELRDWVGQRAIKARTAAGANKPVTPAQQRLQKNDFLAKVATLSGGDPDKAEAIIANDKDVAAAASALGIQTYEARAASAAVGAKAANAATGANIKLQASGMVPGAGGAAPTAADINAARSGLTVAPPVGARPAAPAQPITPLVTPRAGLNPNATAPYAPPPKPAPGPVPQTPAPLATPRSAAPTAAPAQPMSITPLAKPGGSAPSAVPSAAPTAPPSTPLNMKPVDETALDHHTLWNLKVQGGMKPADATAYVLKVKGPQVAPKAVAPVVVPPEEDEEAPSGPTA